MGGKDHDDREGETATLSARGRVYAWLYVAAWLAAVVWVLRSSNDWPVWAEVLASAVLMGAAPGLISGLLPRFRRKRRGDP